MMCAYRDRDRNRQEKSEHKNAKTHNFVCLFGGKCKC